MQTASRFHSRLKVLKLLTVRVLQNSGGANLFTAILLGQVHKMFAEIAVSFFAWVRLGIVCRGLQDVEALCQIKSRNAPKIGALGLIAARRRAAHRVGVLLLQLHAVVHQECPECTGGHDAARGSLAAQRHEGNWSCAWSPGIMAEVDAAACIGGGGGSATVEGHWIALAELTPVLRHVIARDIFHSSAMHNVPSQQLVNKFLLLLGGLVLQKLQGAQRTKVNQPAVEALSDLRGVSP